MNLKEIQGISFRQILTERKFASRTTSAIFLAHPPRRDHSQKKRWRPIFFEKDPLILQGNMRALHFVWFRLLIYSEFQKFCKFAFSHANL